jgi:hypothetical protein
MVTADADNVKTGEFKQLCDGAADMLLQQLNPG